MLYTAPKKVYEMSQNNKFVYPKRSRVISRKAIRLIFFLKRKKILDYITAEWDLIDI